MGPPGGGRWPGSVACTGSGVSESRFGDMLRPAGMDRPLPQRFGAHLYAACIAQAGAAEMWQIRYCLRIEQVGAAEMNFRVYRQPIRRDGKMLRLAGIRTTVAQAAARELVHDWVARPACADGAAVLCMYRLRRSNQRERDRKM